ncbi:MAG: ATP-binding cassette domain-containing protein [Clostridiales bacterium]|nr:ATP-binding cassette domain-containing protein [Clostridiales bacterium]
MIQVEKLEKRYGPIHAVKGISFEVREGEIFGFLGPNGAGKTTTMKMLATLVRPTAGRARVAGYDVATQPNDVRRSIGMVFQDPSLDDRLTAYQNLRFHAMLYGVPADVARRRMEELLTMVELQDRLHSRVKTFSGGMRRRLEIARGLLHRPKVLFLDEPTVGLDTQTRRKIWSYIHELREKEGIAVFMSTHYLDEAENCDRIAIMDHGEIVALDTPDGLKSMVGGDVITLSSEDPGGLLTAIRERWPHLQVRPGPQGQVVVETADGASWVPRLVEAFPQHIQAVTVSRPSLDDVFIKLTGRAIRDEEASAVDRMRLQRRR